MLNLGTIRKNGKIINHRSLFKVVLNPVFRSLGFCIGTPYDLEKDKFCGIFIFMKCPRKKIQWKSYDMTDCVLEKRRRII